MSIPKYRVDRLIVHALTGGLSGSSPNQLLLNKKGVDTMPKVEVKKVQEHYEVYVDGIFKCSCDCNEIRQTIVDTYISLSQSGLYHIQ